jgi:hypothetical protein
MRGRVNGKRLTFNKKKVRVPEFGIRNPEFEFLKPFTLGRRAVRFYVRERLCLDTFLPVDLLIHITTTGSGDPPVLPCRVGDAHERFNARQPEV